MTLTQLLFLLSMSGDSEYPDELTLRSQGVLQPETLVCEMSCDMSLC